MERTKPSRESTSEFSVLRVAHPWLFLLAQGCFLNTLSA